ncbi:MAG: hypothetical protein ACYC4K_02875 [Thiobacillus sp.]
MTQTITKKIINLTAQVTSAPVPSQLQQSGSIISVGGTTLATGTYQFCGQLSTVESLLQTTGTGNYAELQNMATTFFAQGTGVGLYVLELGYNANIVTQIQSLQTWITANPGTFYSYLTPVDWDTLSEEVGSITVGAGTYTYTAAPTVTITAATGAGVTATATATINSAGQVTAITITNPGYYPSQAAPTATLSAAATGTAPALTVNMANAQNVLSANYESPTGKTYFFVTTTQSGAASYAANKAIFATIVAPTAPSTEFTAAMPFYQALVNNPSASNPLAPMAFRYAYGVTNWPQSGQNASITNALSVYTNLILSGAEGGISNSCLFKGTTMDGTQFSWWYGIDWFQIQVNQALAAAVINGSNSNPPLLYNQNGINTLQKIAQQVANSAVKFGCALSAVVNATPFGTYTTDNPTNYQAGIYNGLSATVVGQNGFLVIDFALDALQFVA